MLRRLVTTAVCVLTVQALVGWPAGGAQAAVDTLLPTPGTPVVVEVTHTTAALTWTPSDGPVAGYTLAELDTVWNPEEIRVATVEPRVTLTGLQPDRMYQFRVVAHAEPGSGFTDSAASNYVVFVTPFVPETEPPTAPGRPRPTIVSTNNVSLEYAAATDNARVARYVIQMLSDEGWIDRSTANGTRAGLSNLVGDTSYTVAVVAVDPSGNRSPRSASTTFRTRPFTADPGCLVTLRPEAGYYQLTVQLQNSTVAEVRQPVVTFTMPPEHNATEPYLTRDGASASLGWPANTVLEPGRTAMRWFYVRTHGDPTLPDGFRVGGSPCEVRQV